MDGLRLVHANSHQWDAWDTFVHSHPDGTLFHTSVWILAQKELKADLILAMKNDVFVGGFAYTMNTKAGLKRIIRPALCSRFGPLVSDALSFEDQVGVMQAIRKTLPSHDLRGFVSRGETTNALLKQVFGGAEQWVPTNTKVLPETTDALLESYQGGIRRNIRHALAEGGRMVAEADPKQAYGLFQHAYQSRGAEPRFGLEQFVEQCERLRRGGWATLVGVSDGSGDLVGALYLVFDQKTAFYIVSGTDKNALGGNTGALLVHFALRFAQDRGLLFDFNGSSIPGINEFFLKFKPDPQQVLQLRKAVSLKGTAARAVANLLGKRII